MIILLEIEHKRSIEKGHYSILYIEEIKKILSLLGMKILKYVEEKILELKGKQV